MNYVLQEAKTVPKKIDIGGAPEEIFLDDDDCNSTEKADTSSIGVLQHPFGARCIVGGPGDAMLERLQRKMDYGMQALNLILVRFLQRKMTSKSVEHSLCEYFKFCRAAKGHLVETGNVESSIS